MYSRSSNNTFIVAGKDGKGLESLIAKIVLLFECLDIYITSLIQLQIVVDYVILLFGDDDEFHAQIKINSLKIIKNALYHLLSHICKRLLEFAQILNIYSNVQITSSCTFIAIAIAVN
uniref:Uncharacterized protein n=1 Tax=Glossina brevipalpis TaxID=37001 RepID=A0A1A9WZ02_9MUSC